MIGLKLITSVIFLLTSSSVNCASIASLEKTISSHSESLRTVNGYLAKVDQFWRWFNMNHRSLNGILDNEGSKRKTYATQQQITELQEQIERLKTQYEFMDLQRGQTEELTSKVDKALADQSVLSDEMMNFNKTLDDINMFIRNVFSKVNSNMRDLEDKFKGVLNKTHEEEFKGEIKQLKDFVNEKVSTVDDVIQRAIDRIPSADGGSADAGLNSKMASLQSQIDDFRNSSNSRLESLQDRISNLGSQITNFQTTLGKEQGRISNVQGTLHSLNLTINKVATNLDRLKTSGGNLDSTTLNPEETTKTLQDFKRRLDELEEKVNQKSRSKIIGDNILRSSVTGSSNFSEPKIVIPVPVSHDTSTTTTTESFNTWNANNNFPLERRLNSFLSDKGTRPGSG